MIGHYQLAAIEETYAKLAIEEDLTKDEIKKRRNTLLKIGIPVFFLAAILFFFAINSENSFWQSILIELSAGFAFFVAIPIFVELGEKNKVKVLVWTAIISLILLFISYFSNDLWQGIFIEFSTGMLIAAILNLFLEGIITKTKNEFSELKEKRKNISLTMGK